MTKEIARLSADEGAKQCDRMVIQGQADIIRGYLTVAEGLYFIQEHKWYKNLGYKNLREYIAARIKFKPAKAYGLIQVYKTFVIGYGYPKGELAKIDWSKLYILASHATNENHKELIANAESMPKSQLIKTYKGKKRHPHSCKEVGERINLQVLQYAPINEAGVVFLFGHLCGKLGFAVDYISTPLPDCRAHQLQSNGKYRERLIEFEFKSGNFKIHGHNPSGCDLIICWEHNWKDCPIEVISLRDKLKEFALNRRE